jgi:hypothetical protein
VLKVSDIDKDFFNMENYFNYMESYLKELVVCLQEELVLIEQ